MKIGIITFHWATNHGAILQAYSTLKYLQDNFNLDVEVIDYVPRKAEINMRYFLKPCRPKSYLIKFRELQKEKRLRKFRDELSKSPKFYYSRDLRMIADRYDLIFAGSDQIWNPYYVKSNVDESTLTYFLDFVGNYTMKIGLSVSFGCDVYPQETARMIFNCINEFDYISVREDSGMKILESIGYNGRYMKTPDPTILLDRQSFLLLMNNNKPKESKFIAKCILREEQFGSYKLIDNYAISHSLKLQNIANEAMDVWISDIYYSTLVITNSFHCIMISLKLHKDFFVILEDKSYSGMNDRFFSLLKVVGLEERIINKTKTIPNCVSKIDWFTVERKMEEYSNSLKIFISEVIDKCRQNENNEE